ncbi:MAG: adenylate/guanylate cyclase domain-containing protein [Thermodesulfobacteriota bacterium]
MSKDKGFLISWGGEISAYGITDLQPGQPIGEQLFFIDDLLPLDQSPLHLACVKTGEGVVTDIHIFQGDQCDWILLLDASRKETSAVLLQQKTNELSLLRQKMNSSWNHIGGDHGSSGINLETFGLADGVDRREVSVLRADITGLNSSAENQPPEQIFSVLQKQLSMIMLPVTDAGGIIVSISGASTTALFGVLPSAISPADQSVTAAVRIMETVAHMTGEENAARPDALPIKIGISSGLVSLGFRNDKNKSFHVVGYPLEHAAMLARQAEGAEIAIDLNTANKIDLECYRKRFPDIVPGEVESSSRQTGTKTEPVCYE